MPNTNIIHSYISISLQKIIVNWLKKNSEKIKEIAEREKQREKASVSTSALMQIIILNILKSAFTLTISSIIGLLKDNRAIFLHDYISSQYGNLLGTTWAYTHIKPLVNNNKEDLDILIKDFIDYYYTSLGNSARKNFKIHFNSSKQKVTPPIDIFIGKIAPTEMFNTLNGIQLGYIMPFFNLILLREVKKISGTRELDGILKESEFFEDNQYFKIAGTLGFLNRPPGVNKIYEGLEYVERMLKKYSKKKSLMKCVSGKEL